MEIEKVLFEDYEKISDLNKRNNLSILEKLDWENLWKKIHIFDENSDWTIGWKLVNEKYNCWNLSKYPLYF